MALLMKHVGTNAESIVVTQLSTGRNYNIRGENNRVDLAVDGEGITIGYQDNRVLKITYSDSKLTFADTTSTYAQIVFSIVSGNHPGDSTFDVERSAGSQQFKITNTDLRFYNEYLDPGQIPREVYRILTQTSDGEDTSKLST